MPEWGMRGKKERKGADHEAEKIRGIALQPAYHLRDIGIGGRIFIWEGSCI